MHVLFQMYNYEDKLRLEKDGRGFYSEHKLFNAAVEFCQNGTSYLLFLNVKKGTELF